MASFALPYVLPRVSDPHLEARKYLNLLLSLAARRRRDDVVLAKPFEVTIDPSTICQLECPYCDVGAGHIRRERGLLKPAVHRNYVHELATEMFVAWYFSTGEPLINRRFAEVVSGIRDRGVFSIVSTNLSLRLSDTRIDELLACGLGIILVSLDGASAETYPQYRTGGEFDLVVHNMRRLIDRKRDLGLEYPLIEWRFLIFEHNHHEVPAVRDLARKIGVDLLELFYGLVPTPLPPGAAVRPAPVQDIGPLVSGPAFDRGLARTETALRAHFKPYGMDLPWTTVDEAQLRRKCDWLYFGSTLFPNGSVSPCCVSNHEPDDFGRIGEGGFSEVWNNGMYRAARQLFVKGRGDRRLICDRCPLPVSQDYQFRAGLQGLLRNAPDWVLHVLTQGFDDFFYSVDADLYPEVVPLRDRTLSLQPDVSLAEWVFDEVYGGAHRAHPDVESIRVLLRSAGAIARPSGFASAMSLNSAGQASAGGYLDECDAMGVAGWVWSHLYPDERFHVTVRVGDRVAGRVLATEYRQDVQAAGIGDGKYGFHFVFPDALRPRTGDVVVVTVGDDGPELHGSPRPVLPPPSSEGESDGITAVGERDSIERRVRLPLAH